MPDEKWLKRSPDISLKNEYQKGQTRERKKERGTERERDKSERTLTQSIAQISDAVEDAKWLDTKIC